MEAQTILKAANIWDGMRSEVVADGAVLIENGRIRAAGPAREILTASEARVMEWPEATLLPGLIDSHTHLSMDASLPNYLDRMSDPIPVLTLRATTMMRRDLVAGVTTCRCLGDREFLDIACRDAVAKGEIPGPRLLVAARGIRAPHGHGFVGYPFNGESEIRNAIRENIGRGADLTKIYITGTLKGAGDLPAYLTHGEVGTAISESHAAGVPVASHCVGGAGLDWALELGLDTLEHAYHITRAQAERLAASRTALVLTPAAVLSERRVRNLPERLIQGHIDEHDQMFEAMSLAVKTGMPFAVGTDGMHGELAEDMEYLTRLGATKLQALQAATLHAARICGISTETGSLEKGKRADIIAVAGNPLKDLGALRRIRAVMLRGVLVHEETGTPSRTENFAYGTQ